MCWSGSITTAQKTGRCQGTTAKGKPCAAKAGDNGYCRYHQDQNTTAPADPGF